MSTLSTTAQLPTSMSTDAVEETYRSTVMAVSHYAEDYGDTYRESIWDEFGAEIATALDVESTVTPLLEGQLRQAAQHATEERDHFLTVLDLEETALNDAVEPLTSVCDGWLSSVLGSSTGVQRPNWNDCKTTLLRWKANVNRSQRRGSRRFENRSECSYLM